MARSFAEQLDTADPYADGVDPETRRQGILAGIFLDSSSEYDPETLRQERTESELDREARAAFEELNRQRRELLEDPSGDTNTLTFDLELPEADSDLLRFGGRKRGALSAVAASVAALQYRAKSLAHQFGDQASEHIPGSVARTVRRTIAELDAAGEDSTLLRRALARRTARIAYNIEAASPDALDSLTPPTRAWDYN